MKKRAKINKDRNQLAFDLDSILVILEDKFIKKLTNFFNKIANKLLKKADTLAIFKKEILKPELIQIVELKALFKNYYKQISKEAVKSVNTEIKALSGQLTRITIPDINEGLRYRAELLALKKAKDFRDSIIEKVLEKEGTIKSKKDLVMVVKRANKSFVAKNIQIVARMESVTAVNTERIEAMNKSKIVKGVQFLAVLDKRTTQICRARHNKVFKLDDTKTLANYRPPCHWGCRSLLSPVTIFETIPFTPEKELSSVPPRDFGKLKDNPFDQTKIEKKLK